MLATSAALMASLALAATIFLDVLLRAVKGKAPKDFKKNLPVDEWLRKQRAIVDFTYFGTPRPPLQARLALRAQPNQRLVSAFGITNSLTTTSIHIHNDFLRMASEIINSGDATRWSGLYEAAEKLLNRDAGDVREDGLALADCAQRLCLVVVLFDNFGLDPMSIPIDTARAITRTINSQWLASKCNQATPKSQHLGNLLDNLGLRGKKGDVLAAEEVLGIIMPQYETLWRVVLLTFVTAYHRQYQPDFVAMVRDVPACLGNKLQEKDALQLAQVSRMQTERRGYN